MPISITSLPLWSHVKDPSTLFNGEPIKWRILDFNHAGYPTGTVTLFAWNAGKFLTVSPETTSLRDKTFRNIPVAAASGGGTVGSYLDAFYESLSPKLKGRVIDTPLDTGYSGNYSTGTTAYRNEKHKIFLFGASENRHGSSTFLSGAATQKYFTGMSAFSTILYMALNLPDSSQPFLSRDIRVSSSGTYKLYPGFKVNDNSNYSTSSSSLNVVPMMNISTTDLTVLDEKDADNCYILNLTENKFLIEDNNDIKRYVTGWETVGQKPATKAMFDQYGMKNLQDVAVNINGLVSMAPEILCWTDDTLPTPLRYVHATGAPKGLLLELTSSLTVRALQGMRFDATVAGTNVLRFAFSGDDGKTWSGATGIISLDANAVATSGYTLAQLTALTASDWSRLFPSGSVRVALYLERQNTTDTLEVRAWFATEIKYTVTPALSGLSNTFERLIGYQPVFSVSRDDGITWQVATLDEMNRLDQQPLGKELRIKATFEQGVELHALGYAWN